MTTVDWPGLVSVSIRLPLCQSVCASLFRSVLRKKEHHSLDTGIGIGIGIGHASIQRHSYDSICTA